MPFASPRSLLTLGAAACLAAGAVSGCSMFRKNTAYAQPAEARPLEVPPDLDRPSTEAALGGSQSVMRSTMASPGAAAGVASPAAAAAASATSFSMPGQRDAVFAQVGQALAGIQGVTVAGSAQLLGTHDVNYQGSSMLIRVAQAGEQVTVSAVDARGIAASGAAPAALMAALRSALGQ